MPAAVSDERGHHREVVREVRIPRQPVRGDRQGAGAEVVLRVGERVTMGVEDVGVEDVERIDDERARDPCDVPDREPSVVEVEAPDWPSRNTSGYVSAAVSITATATTARSFVRRPGCDALGPFGACSSLVETTVSSG